MRNSLRNIFRALARLAIAGVLLVGLLYLSMRIWRAYEGPWTFRYYKNPEGTVSLRIAQARRAPQGVTLHSSIPAPAGFREESFLVAGETALPFGGMRHGDFTAPRAMWLSLSEPIRRKFQRRACPLKEKNMIGQRLREKS